MILLAFFIYSAYYEIVLWASQSVYVLELYIVYEVVNLKRQFVLVFFGSITYDEKIL